MKFSTYAMLLVFCLGWWGREAHAKKARTIFLDEKNTERIFIKPGLAAILNFPSSPGDVVLGNEGIFSVKHIRSDLAVGALRSAGHSNLFVYLEGRRYGFDLVISSDGFDEIVNVRDPSEKKMKTRFKDE
jgi:hypothetical protein